MVGADFSPCYVPSPYQWPLAWPGQVVPTNETDNRVLWDAQAKHLHKLFGDAVNATGRRSDCHRPENVRDLIHTDHPLLAADPVLGPWQQTAEFKVAQTGAWIRPDERPLPPGLREFLDSGAAPVYVGLLRGADDIVQPVIQAVRAHDRRVTVGCPRHCP